MGYFKRAEFWHRTGAPSKSERNEVFMKKKTDVEK